MAKASEADPPKRETTAVPRLDTPLSHVPSLPLSCDSGDTGREVITEK
jgi:hypothetical protein